MFKNLLIQLVLLMHNVNGVSQSQPKTLAPRKPAKKFTRLNQIQLFLLVMLVSIILLAIVFTFMPPLESGVSYRFTNYI